MLIQVKSRQATIFTLGELHMHTRNMVCIYILLYDHFIYDNYEIFVSSNIDAITHIMQFCFVFSFGFLFLYILPNTDITFIVIKLVKLSKGMFG